MVSKDEEILVSDLLMSSVVPAIAAADDKVMHNCTNMDLVMKLHYLRGVYFFAGDESIQGVDIDYLKPPMFWWLELYHPAAGRIRRSEDNGRPFIRCNDAGVRIIEVMCSKTLNEWLALTDHSLDNDQLTYNDVLGPDLFFSPLVFIQLTRFKCGGLSVGLSWSHILGDAFSASTFINTWGNVMGGSKLPAQPPKTIDNVNSQVPSSFSRKPISVKRVEPSVGDHWLAPTKSRMQSCFFHFTAKQLNNLMSKVLSQGQANGDIQAFEILCATMWKSLANVRGEDKTETRVVTVCRNDSYKTGNISLSNSQSMGVVEAEINVAKADVLELAKLIAQGGMDETHLVEHLMEKQNGDADVIVYGANLTFVNLEGAKIYDLEIKGTKPVYANYSFAGVGEEGTVLVLPGPEQECLGRTVTVTLPENQIKEFKDEFKREWGMYLSSIEAVLGLN